MIKKLNPFIITTVGNRPFMDGVNCIKLLNELLEKQNELITDTDKRLRAFEDITKQLIKYESKKVDQDLERLNLK